MSVLRFLSDENVPEALLYAVNGKEPAIDFQLVGHGAAHPKEHPTPDYSL